MRALRVWRCGLESTDQGITRSRMRAAIHDDFQVSSRGQLLDDESRAQFHQRLRGVAALAFIWDKVEKMMAAATASDVMG